MPVGKSGRIVIEIDPALKQTLYESLREDDSCMKDWFLRNVDDYLAGKDQLQLDLLNQRSTENDNAL